jgi:hypothetical protein
MTVNHDFDVRGRGIEIDLFTDMREVDQMLTDFHGFVPGKFLSPSAVIDIPAHGDGWSNRIQLIEHFLLTDIASV